MIEKDINLFEVSPVKNVRRKGGGSVLLLSLFFALVVGGCYGWLLHLQSGVEQEVARIEQQLADPQLVEAQQRLKVQLEKYNLMSQYHSVLASAGEAFDHTRLLSPDLMGQLTGCLTADTTLIDLNVSLQGASLVCRSTSFLAPAAIAQALERLDAVSTAQYDAVTFDQENKLYYFTLACSFEEVTLP